ncbi:MAG: (d)CMP kinase [Actinomycetota bacterium]
MSAVAIDGPAGAGKTTVARALADRLGWTYIDTGAMYRAVAFAVLESGIDPNDAERAAAKAWAATIELTPGAVLLDGRDVTNAIRKQEVSQAASLVSQHPGVRARLVELQRAEARRADVVMEGRDIGTVVLPDADVKVFLTATLEQRAVRRAEELGSAEDAEAIREAIELRDRTDEQRSASPLARATGAVVVDTTDKSIEQVVEEIAALVARARVGLG